jgi:hypothetical protein
MGLGKRSGKTLALKVDHVSTTVPLLPRAQFLQVFFVGDVDLGAKAFFLAVPWKSDAVRRVS